MPINFFSEETTFKLDQPSFYENWLQEVLFQHSKSTGELNYIFSSDEYLLRVNQKHLNHDYYTDIVTFDHSDHEDVIEADIYISIDRVRDNAFAHEVSFQNELSRVMVHGLLHLFGFSDENDLEKKVMREKEDACISLQKK